LCRKELDQSTTKDVPVRTDPVTVASLPNPRRRPVLWEKRALGAAVALILLGGCASPPQLTPIGKGKPVVMFVVSGPQNEGLVNIRHQTLGNDTLVGTGSGAVIGGLYGLTCGPWVLFCVPFGMGIGALYGTVAGAAVGATG
jgi:hypothetical protein